jgi:hypothetical protein
MRARDARHPLDGLRFYGKFLLALLIIGYILMKIIIYLTRIVAYYLLYGVWRFF